MKNFIYLLFLFIPVALSGCGDSETGTEPVSGDTPGMIGLVGPGVETITGSRAVADFPNSRQIGVIAAEYTAGSIDWTSYADIDNAVATAIDETGGLFSFSWSDAKYWPMDDRELVFMAYSPPANGTSVILAADRTRLDLQLVEGMPDVMYASNNTTAAGNPYKKSDGTVVDLGEFRHALSKVTLEVVAGENMNPDIRLAELTVTTGYPTATLDLLAGDSGLALGAAGSFTYSVVTASTAFATTFSKELFFFPGTDASTTVSVKFTDGYFSVSYTYTVADFTNIIAGGSALTFERGMNTTLRFTVVGTLVQEPADNMVLQGLLTDWYENGDLELNIE